MDGVSEQSVARLLDTIYDAALDPTAWQGVLERLSELFGCHFADLFTRSHDRSRYRGLSIGLDRADYQRLFLDTWFKRNVWGLSRPVRAAGEVLSTRQMVDIGVLVRSEIYADYLAPRGLHEGLRLAIWSDDQGIQDISLLRPWSRGPFEAAELDLGRRLLPHLQRAAKIARRLDYAETASRGGLMALESAGFAVVLLDSAGQAVVLNGAAEALLRSQDGLQMQGRALVASSRDGQRALRAALDAGLRPDPLRRTSASVRLLRPSGNSPLVLVTLPVHKGAVWAGLDAPALLVLVTDPHARVPSAAQLAVLFGLTDAEADLAEQLLAGLDLREIAARQGRSINTLRNHLARLMNKTDTTRQAELVHLLRGVPATQRLLGPDG